MLAALAALYCFDLARTPVYLGGDEAHFAVGAAKSIVTNRSWWASGAEMTIVGIVEAAVTYGLGLAFAGRG